MISTSEQRAEHPFIGRNTQQKQLVYLLIVTGKTLGKLPWKSKVQLQRNGMAAIPKHSDEYVRRMWYKKCKKKFEMSK